MKTINEVMNIELKIRNFEDLTEEGDQTIGFIDNDIELVYTPGFGGVAGCFPNDDKDSEFTGKYVIAVDSVWIELSNEFENMAEFILAHEVGHIRLGHCDNAPPEMDYDKMVEDLFNGIKDEEEYQADKYAIDILDVSKEDLIVIFNISDSVHHRCASKELIRLVDEGASLKHIQNVTESTAHAHLHITYRRKWALESYDQK